MGVSVRVGALFLCCWLLVGSGPTAHAQQSHVECVVLVRDGDQSYGIFKHTVRNAGTNALSFTVLTDDLAALFSTLVAPDGVSFTADAKAPPALGPVPFQKLTLPDALGKNRGQSVTLTLIVNKAPVTVKGTLIGFQNDVVQVLVTEKTTTRLEQYKTANIQSIVLDAKLTEQAKLAAAELKKKPGKKHEIVVRQVGATELSATFYYQIPVKPWSLNYELVKDGKESYKNKQWKISARASFENTSGSDWTGTEVVLRQDSIEYPLPHPVHLASERRINVVAILPRPISVTEQSVAFLTGKSGSAETRSVLKLVNDLADTMGERLALVKGPVLIRLPKRKPYRSELKTDLFAFDTFAPLPAGPKDPFPPKPTNTAELEYGLVAELAVSTKVSVVPYVNHQVQNAEMTYSERRKIQLMVQNNGQPIALLRLQMPTETDWDSRLSPAAVQLPAPGAGRMIATTQNGRAKKKLDLLDVPTKQLDEIAATDPFIHDVQEMKKAIDDFDNGIQSAQAKIKLLERAQQGFAGLPSTVNAPSIRRNTDSIDRFNRQILTLRDDRAQKRNELIMLLGGF